MAGRLEKLEKITYITLTKENKCFSTCTDDLNTTLLEESYTSLRHVLNKSFTECEMPGNVASVLIRQCFLCLLNVIATVVAVHFFSSDEAKLNVSFNDIVH